MLQTFSLSYLPAMGMAVRVMDLKAFHPHLVTCSAGFAHRRVHGLVYLTRSLHLCPE